MLSYNVSRHISIHLSIPILPYSSIFPIYQSISALFLLDSTFIYLSIFPTLFLHLSLSLFFCHSFYQFSSFYSILFYSYSLFLFIFSIFQSLFLFLSFNLSLFPSLSFLYLPISLSFISLVYFSFFSLLCR